MKAHLSATVTKRSLINGIRSVRANLHRAMILLPVAKNEVVAFGHRLCLEKEGGSPEATVQVFD